jgi:hypothetical protein
MSEKTLHKSVCDYLRLQYPGVLFNSDLAGATKLTIGQATAMKALRSNRGFPDLVIYEPRGFTNYINSDKLFEMTIFHGLFLELKVEGTRIFNSKGFPATSHIQEQLELITKLQIRGYKASFAVGFDEAKSIIDEYLKTK